MVRVAPLASGRATFRHTWDHKQCWARQCWVRVTAPASVLVVPPSAPPPRRPRCAQARRGWRAPPFSPGWLAPPSLLWRRPRRTADLRSEGSDVTAMKPPLVGGCGARDPYSHAQPSDLSSRGDGTHLTLTPDRKAGTHNPRSRSEGRAFEFLCAYVATLWVVATDAREPPALSATWSG